jgi:hypothetical protein
MDAISLLLTVVIYLVIFVGLVWVAVWIIAKTLPAEMQVPAKVIVGVVALLALLVWIAHGGVTELPLFRR